MGANEALPAFKGWQTIEKLGEGGMCSVYRVRRPGGDPRDDLALKVLFDKQPNAVERFTAEACLLMKIHHINIVEVVELNDTARPPWLVMKMLSGYDLEEGLSEGPMNPEHAATIFADIANGLQLVHDMGVMHRDIKPANIMMSGDGIPHLLDFGIARDTRKAHMTQQGFVVGTASYLPPEIFVEDDTASIQDTPTSDVYALGQALCEVLTGTPVHSRDGSGTAQFAKIVKDKMSRDFLDPREWRKAVPETLAEIVIDATQAEPEPRIQTAREFETRLRSWLAQRDAKRDAPVTRNLDPSSLPEPPRLPERDQSTHPATVSSNDCEEDLAALPPRASRAGLAVSAAGLLTSAAFIGLVGLIGLVLLYVFRPVPIPSDPAAASAVRAAVASQMDALKTCRVQSPQVVTLDILVEPERIAVEPLTPEVEPAVVECLREAVLAAPIPRTPVRVRLPMSML